MVKNVISLRSISAWAGVAGPLIFVGVFTLEGAARPGYDASSMFISALSLGERGWLQILNFMLLGALLFLFSRRLAAEFPSGRASRWGLALFYLLAGLFFISGPFVMDPAGTPQTEMSLHGLVHGLAGGIVFLVMPIVMFVFLRRFLAEPGWRGFGWFTLALGMVEAGAVLFFTLVSKSPSLSASFAAQIGLVQRLALEPFMLWLLLFAVQLVGIDRQRAL